MDYTERIIRERLNSKRRAVPRGFWDLETLAMATMVIVEEKWGITNPREIPIENMKYPLTLRLFEDYEYVYAAINKLHYTFKDILFWIYQKDITEDDWYFIDNWEVFLKLKDEGYSAPDEFCFNVKAIQLCMKYIIEEKWNIKDPKQLPVENMKCAITERLYNNYQFLYFAIRYNEHFEDDIYLSSVLVLIGKIYNITKDDWYFINNIEKLVELKSPNTDLPKYFLMYKDGILLKNIIKYFIHNNLYKLNRNNIYEKCNEYLLKFFKLGTVLNLYLSYLLVEVLYFSFQPWDFTTPNGFWEDEDNIKYYLNYELHVRKKITKDFYKKNCCSFQRMCENLNISKALYVCRLYGVYTLKNMIVWEGPEYEYFINLRNKLESMNLHFGY